MVKSTFFYRTAGLRVTLQEPRQGRSPQNQHGIWRRTLQEVFDAWTHLRMGSYQIGARWGMPTQKGATRSLETTISC